MNDRIRTTGKCPYPSCPARWHGVERLEPRLLFDAVVDDPLFDRQWIYSDTAPLQAIENWRQDITGRDVVVAIVDNAIETNHPDLADAFVPGLSWDFIDQDADPSPNDPTPAHGTQVAGIVGARANNGIGIAGVAPESRLVGLRHDDTNARQNASALTWQLQTIDIYNNSWGPEDDARRLAGPDATELAALQRGISQGRDGRGAVYVWAAGNGANEGDNINYDGYANSRFTIAVGATTANGTATTYSEPGAPLMVVTASDDQQQQITTTTVTGTGESGTDPDYTFDFGGTSAAAPIASGVIAMMLQVNPHLTWRDVQQILIQSAMVTDPDHPDWQTNAAGLPVNHSYGFGAISAPRAVALAASWQNLPTEMHIGTETIAVNRQVIDNDTTGLRSSVHIDQAMTVQWAEVTVDIDTPDRGQLQIVLQSPGGTRSILAQPHADNAANYNQWRFTSARHWLESSIGNWSLLVRDLESGKTTTVNQWQLDLYGYQRQCVVSGSVIHDRNGDGQRQTDEPGLPYQLVFDDANANGQPDDGEAQTLTDRHGQYTLMLDAGVHQLLSQVRTGLQADTTGSYTLNLSPDQARTEINFFRQLQDPADLDRDGFADLLLIDGQQITAQTHPTDPKPASWQIGRVDPNRWQYIGSGDQNRDGHSDLWWYDRTLGNLSVWLLDTGQYQSSEYIGQVADRQWYPIGLADMDLDGRVDLLWHNSSTGQTSIWQFDDQGGLTATPTLGRVSTLWQGLTAGDLNGDLKPDLLWRHALTGQTAGWMMNGLSVEYDRFMGNANHEYLPIAAVALTTSNAGHLLWYDRQTGRLDLWQLDMDLQLVQQYQLNHPTGSRPAWHGSTSGQSSN